MGGGTAGCVVAGQLAAKSNHTILLIEAGDYFNIFAKIPIAATFFQGSKYDWGFRTEPQKHSSFGMFNEVSSRSDSSCELQHNFITVILCRASHGPAVKAWVAQINLIT